MASTFIISDTHFGHKNILRFEPEARPFTTIQEHDEYLVDQWNGVVGKQDVVWHLGDVVFGKNAFSYLDRLNGTKKLILGNHDRYGMDNYLQYFTKVFSSYKMDTLIMTHIPVHPSQLIHRFTGNIHGHLHSNKVKEANGKVEDPRYFNVCLEHTGLKPIPFETVRKILNG